MIEGSSVHRWMIANHLAPGARLPCLQVLAKLCGGTYHRTRLEVLALAERGVIRRRSPRSFVVHQALPTTEIPEPLCPRRAMIFADRTFEPPGWQDRSITDHFESICQTASAGALEAAILTPDDITIRRIPLLARARPLGWIVSQIIDQSRTRERLYAALREVDQPVVVHGDSLTLTHGAELAWDVVRSDHRGGARALVLQLAQRGCRRLLPLTAPTWLQRNHAAYATHWYVDRHAGYAAGCREAGITLLPAQPWLPERTAFCRELFAESCLAMRGVVAAALEGPEPPDGLIALEDGQALVLGAVCRDLRRPLPIAGYDATWRHRPESAWGVPPIVTWDQDRAGAGAALIHALVARVSDAQAPRRTTLIHGHVVVP